MFTVVRLARAQTPPLLFTSNSLNIINRTSTVRFSLPTAGPEKSDETQGMAEQNKKTEVTEKGDTMTHSFGEGYATRSEEEGFGGVYGQNKVLDKLDEYDKNVHDESQGSHVKEKEKGRNSEKAAHN